MSKTLLRHCCAITDMAYTRAKFESRFDDAMHVVLPHLALVVYGVKHPERKEVNHWCTEIDGQLDKFLSDLLKGDKYLARKKVFLGVYNSMDIYNYDVFKSRVARKFKAEGINVPDDELRAVFQRVCTLLEYLPDVLARKSQCMYQSWLNLLQQDY